MDASNILETDKLFHSGISDFVTSLINIGLVKLGGERDIQQLTILAREHIKGLDCTVWGRYSTWMAFSLRSPISAIHLTGE